MGVWGTAIFSDDTASDVREEYRDLIGEGLPADQATDKILRSYLPGSDEEMPVVWLALAATQWKCGRLEERVKAKALEIIDSEADLKRWPNASLAGKRRSALDRLRAQLLSPQPAAKRRKPYRCSCEWELGELLAYRLVSGNWIALRVTGFSSDKGGVYPQLEILDWHREELPAGEQLAGLPIRIGSGGRIKHGQVTIASASAREFPSARLRRLNRKSEPSEASRIRVASPPGFRGGGLPFVLWRGLDRFLKTEYGLQ